MTEAPQPTQDQQRLALDFDHLFSGTDGQSDTFMQDATALFARLPITDVYRGRLTLELSRDYGGSADSRSYTYDSWLINHGIFPHPLDTRELGIIDPARAEAYEASDMLLDQVEELDSLYSRRRMENFAEGKDRLLEHMRQFEDRYHRPVIDPEVLRKVFVSASEEEMRRGVAYFEEILAL